MVNKISLLVVFLMILNVPIFSQEPLTKNGENSLYYKALKIYLEENEKEYSKLFPQRNFHNVLVIKIDLITTKLPAKIGKFKVEYVDYDELTIRAKNNAEQKKNTQTLIASEFQPITNDKNNIVVTISEYKVTYEESRLSLGLSDGIRIEFKYDCLVGDYVLIKFEFFGV
jgi:phosphopantothenoylcysteine synthetase/decarboxylase